MGFPSYSRPDGPQIPASLNSLLLGTFTESFAMLVTTIPILTPSLEAVGVDLVWFGIIMVILVEAALISPPEGINLYILHGVSTLCNQAA